MQVKSADFVTSSAHIGQCPKPILPEFAFIGRSNVGKSSLINMLVGRKSLAKTSSKPGKTQLINHFIINEQWYLVDLPGLGYAKVSKHQRAKWHKMINNYLLKRENLLNIFVLVDSRIDPQSIDIDFINWLGMSQLPFTILFTKTDKLSPYKLKIHLERFRKELLKTWDELPQIIVTSANTKKGKEEILDLIERTNIIFK
jgi:GTP-binding protein